MCLTPKLLYVKPSESDKRYPFIVPCGKCYECVNVKRAEFCYRCKCERDNSASCFFVTLTYSDNNLHFCTTDLRFTAQKELERIAKLSPKEPYKYKNFVLSKKDFSNFMEKLQSVVKRYNFNLRVRMVLAGEYGTYNYRPHGHALIFFPLQFTIKQCEDIIKECWQFGNISVYNATDGAFNYLAKHFIKDDCGSELQQKVSPRFLKYSVYDGGIGHQLINNKSLLVNYFNNVMFSYSGKYKVSIPRFLRRKLHPLPFSAQEIKERGLDSIANFIQRQYFNGVQIDRSEFLEFFDNTKGFSLSKFYELTKDGRLINFNKVLHYKRQKFAKKVLSLQRQGYYERPDNNIV